MSSAPKSLIFNPRAFPKQRGSNYRDALGSHGYYTLEHMVLDGKYNKLTLKSLNFQSWSPECLRAEVIYNISNHLRLQYDAHKVTSDNKNKTTSWIPILFWILSSSSHIKRPAYLLYCQLILSLRIVRRLIPCIHCHHQIITSADIV